MWSNRFSNLEYDRLNLKYTFNGMVQMKKENHIVLVYYLYINLIVQLIIYDMNSIFLN